MEKATSYQSGQDYRYDIPLSKQSSYATVIVGIVSSDCGNADKSFLKISVARENDGSLSYYIGECDDSDAPSLVNVLPNFFENLYNEYVSQW